MMIRLSELTPNDRNHEIYSNSDLSDLKTSLEENGQLEPIVVNKKNIIISGHRRYYSMLQLGWENCEIRVGEFDNEIISLIEFNRTRVKTRNDILREAKILEEEIKKDLGKSKRENVEKKNYQVITEVANRLGDSVGLTQLKQLKSIQNYEPTFIDKIDKGEMSVSGAYKVVQEKHIKRHVKKTDSDSFAVEMKKLIKKYNPTKDDIFGVLKTTYPFSTMNLGEGETDPDNIERNKEILVNHLDFLKTLDAREYTLYKKMSETEYRKPITNSDELFERVWRPKDIFDKKKTINEIELIEPIIEIASGDETTNFENMRRLIHSSEWKSNPGRIMRLFVKDKISDKVLGLITIASDVVTHSERDKFIGWSSKVKMDNKMINHIANGTTIVPTQPLGFNFLGGKLIACMVVSPQTTERWFSKYKDRLIGITTTGLYGTYSQYTRIPLWKKLSRSLGDVYITPDDRVYDFWRGWLKENHSEKYKELQSKSGPKQKHLNEIYRLLGLNLSNLKHQFERGVFFAPLYKNGNDFLNKKITDDQLIEDDRYNDDFILNWWKERSIKRYTKLHKSDSLVDEVLWYDNFTEQKSKLKSWLDSRGKKFFQIPNEMPRQYIPKDKNHD